LLTDRGLGTPEPVSPPQAATAHQKIICSKNPLLYADLGIVATRSRVACEPPAFRPKIAKHSLAMPIIQWPVIMRVPTLAAC